MRSHAFSFFFFNDTATTEIYTLSLHDALPISMIESLDLVRRVSLLIGEIHSASSEQLSGISQVNAAVAHLDRSEEHTSELQSRLHLVCRLLLEKKKYSAYHALSLNCSHQHRCS